MRLTPKYDNPVCRECFKKHLEKYDGFVDEDGNVHRGFTVPCQGIPVRYLSEHLESILDEESQKEAIGIFDPVAWAAAWIKKPDGNPWIARWYQAELMRCTAKRRVVRAARRIGKTDALSVHILHYCFTNKNKRVLVVAPYKSQTQEIIDRVRNFITSNPNLAMSVERDVSSPFFSIKLKNGSEIRGFSSGTKSGAEAGAVRGQDADRIYIDEVDYLTDGDLKAIIAIVNTNENVELWASSTPTGRRSHFWRWCEKSPSYKEFYYSSEVLPFWETQRDQVRADYIGNADGWTHEVMAEWGEQTVGVFQHIYVDAALTEYKYQEMVRKQGWVYSIGIDWNSNFGTEIVTVGYDGHGQFQTVDALNIPKQGWTQLAGLEATIAANAKWRPAFIYCDEGHGATNLELLRKYGYDMISQDAADPACKLKDIVKGYNFSAKIDAHDPMTKLPIKKSAKPFMVENAARFFEESRIIISAFDMVLRQQLENYIIKHRTTAGIPVYGVLEERIGDHRLDAFMLALVGFKLEMSDFGRPVYTTHIAISPGFARLQQNIQQVDPKKELANRAKRLPESRFDEDQQSIIYGPNATIPAKIHSAKVPIYRHGFMTDDEDRYRIEFALRNAKRKSRLHGKMPFRKNI